MITVAIQFLPNNVCQYDSSTTKINLIFAVLRPWKCDKTKLRDMDQQLKAHTTLAEDPSLTLWFPASTQVILQPPVAPAPGDPIFHAIVSTCTHVTYT